MKTTRIKIFPVRVGYSNSVILIKREKLDIGRCLCEGQYKKIQNVVSASSDKAR